MLAYLDVVFSFPVGSYVNGPKTTQEQERAGRSNGCSLQSRTSITEPGAAIWTLLFFTQMHLTE